MNIFFYKNKPIGFKPNPWPRSQDLKNLSILSLAVNILKREDMINLGSLVRILTFIILTGLFHGI